MTVTRKELGRRKSCCDAILVYNIEINDAVSAEDMEGSRVLAILDVAQARYFGLHMER